MSETIAPTEYQIRYRLTVTEGQVNPWTLYGEPVTSLTEVMTSLEPDTTYDLQILATDDLGATTSNVVTFTTSQSPPSAPGIPVPGTITPNSIVVNWAPSSSGTNIVYQPMYAVQGSALVPYGNPISGTSITFTPLIPLTNYVIEIVAENSLGMVPSPSIVVQTLAPGIPPSPPTQLGVTNVGQTQLQLNWTASTTGTTPIFYQPYFRLTGSATFIAFGPTTAATSAIITGLTPGSTYDFTVGSINSIVGFPVDAVTFVTQQMVAAAVAVNAPGIPVASAITGQSAVITWPASTVGSPTISYQVQFRPSPLVDPFTVSFSSEFGGGGQAFVNFGSPVTALSVTLTGLLPGTPYDVVVIANNPVNVPATSPLGNFTTTVGAIAPAPPTGLSVMNVTQTGFLLSWLPSATGSAPITYQPQIAPALGGPFTNIGVGPVSGNSVAVTGLTAGTGYLLQVGAINPATAGGLILSAVLPQSTAPVVIGNTESVGGTTLTTTTGIIFASQTPGTVAPVNGPFDQWTMIQSTNSGLEAAKNGVADVSTSLLIEMYYSGHFVYYEAQRANSLGVNPGWWQWNGTAWIDCQSPLPSGPVESLEGTILNTAGSVINASRTQGVASTGPFDTWALTSANSIFDDEFTSFTTHLAAQSGDNWGYCEPGTPNGRGGSNFGETIDQWWLNPFNTNTPITGVYTLVGNVLQLGIVATPSGADQTYINAQAGETMNNFTGAQIYSFAQPKRVFGYTEVTVSVDRVKGFVWQTSLSTFDAGATPKIDIAAYTNSDNSMHVFFNVALTTAPLGLTFDSVAFDITQPHKYAVNWQSDFITFYVDGVVVHSVATPTTGGYTTTACGQLILTGAAYIYPNVALDPATLPANAHVDSVRWYPNVPSGATGQVLLNGNIASVSGGASVDTIRYHNHTTYFHVAAGWFLWQTSTQTFIATTDPTLAISPDGATINSTSGSLVDSNGIPWTLVSSASNGLQVARAGTVDGTTSNDILLLWFGGKIYRESQAPAPPSTGIPEVTAIGGGTIPMNNGDLLGIDPQGNIYISHLGVVTDIPGGDSSRAAAYDASTNTIYGQDQATGSWFVELAPDNWVTASPQPVIAVPTVTPPPSWFVASTGLPLVWTSVAGDPRTQATAHVTGITLSNTTIVTGQPAGTVVGQLTVQMSAGTFTGTLSDGGADAASFSINNSLQLVTTGNLPVRSYAVAISSLMNGSTFTQNLPPITVTAVVSASTVVVNRATQLGFTLPATLFGSSMASDVDFTPWLNSQLQAAASGPAGFNLPGMYGRSNTNETAFNSDGSLNTTFIDRVCQALPNILGSGGIFSYSLGGPGVLDPTTFANASLAAHQRFIANGHPVKFYEVLNEPNSRIDLSTVIAIFNATAAKLHAFDPTINVGGPVYSFLVAGDYATFAQQCGAGVGMLPYHSYTFDSSQTGLAFYQGVIARAKSDAAALLNAVRGTGAQNAPRSIGEYNTSAANNSGEPREQTIQAAVYNALLLTQTFLADPLTQYGAIWDWNGDGYFGIIIDPNNNPGNKPAYSLMPNAIMLRFCRQFMAGPVVQSTVPSAYPHLTCLATTNGVLFINYDTSTAYTFPLSGLGAATYTWNELSPAHLTGQSRTITQASLASITIPSESIIVISP